MRRSLIAVLSLVACRDEARVHVGFDQPVRVEDGFFLEGELPTADDGPRVTSLETASAIAIVGQDGRTLRGRSTDDAWAMAVRFTSLGSGWWQHDVGDLAAQFPGERDFALSYDLGTIPPGLHALAIAAVDEEGRRGEPTELDLCVLDDAVPAGLNPCDPTLPPPAAAIVVSWNRAVDLDLVVEDPDGRKIRWKAPTAASPVDGEVPEEDVEDPSVGKLARDSNAGCIADGRNSEAVVWEEDPPAGLWSAYVDLFDACGEDDVTYTVVAYHRRMRDDGTLRLVELARKTGTLVAQFDAYGGAKPPLFVLSTELP